MKNIEILNLAKSLIPTLGEIKNWHLQNAIRKNQSRLESEAKIIHESIQGIQGDKLKKVLAETTGQAIKLFDQKKDYAAAEREAVEAASPGTDILKEYREFARQRERLLNEESGVDLCKINPQKLGEPDVDARQMAMIRLFVDKENED